MSLSAGDTDPSLLSGTLLAAVFSLVLPCPLRALEPHQPSTHLLEGGTREVRQAGELGANYGDYLHYRQTQYKHSLLHINPAFRILKLINK